jgi:hypothetical protein
MAEGWGGSWADENGYISNGAEEQTPPGESDIGIPITDENPEYTKLLNEVITPRCKCGDQAAELAALRQPTQSDALLEVLKTARDYVADVAEGNIHFNDNIKAMAAEDLTRIDAALQEQSK